MTQILKSNPADEKRGVQTKPKAVSSASLPFKSASLSFPFFPKPIVAATVHPNLPLILAHRILF
jgi:hypothetical protein